DIEPTGSGSNWMVSDFEGRWSPDNPNATKPRIVDTKGDYWWVPNTYLYRNNDYLRLKNMEIGYKINLGPNEYKIYLSGVNLITLTSVKDFDPETTSWNAYPLNKVYNIGLSLTF
ncbi:MAG: SusC/RagA family TonB-linked outer membrane protein, partial [Bacteroidota bacterium]